MWYLVRRQVINVATKCMWNTAHKSIITNTVAVRHLEVISTIIQRREHLHLPYAISSSSKEIIMEKLKMFLCLTKRNATRTYLVSEGIAPGILYLLSDWGEWTASRPGLFNPAERAFGSRWIGRYKSQSRSGCGGEEKNPFAALPSMEPQSSNP